MKTDEHIILYYFSGTGNAKMAAEWFKNEAFNRNMTCEIRVVTEKGKIEVPEKENLLIGFFSPTHGFNFPPIMLDFLFRFPRGKKSDVFILNTRAGMKLYKLFLPGLSGAAQFFTAFILWLKNYKIIGMQPLDMPSNWISIHPALRDKVIVSIVNRCERIVKRFADKLFSGKRVYKAFWSLPFDLAILPIAFLYYFIGRFAIAKTFYASFDCTQCGLCSKNCPVNAIETIDSRKFWSYKCESCMKCMSNCPENAIQTSHSYSIALWIILMSFLSPLFVKFFFDLNLEIFKESSWVSWLTEFSIEMLAFFIINIIAYRIFHFFMRFRIVNKIIEYTSLTKYWRNYNLKKTLRRMQKV